MTKMKATKTETQDHQSAWPLKEPPELGVFDRRQGERRVQASKGYTYIQMVGWMDRREQSRRQAGRCVDLLLC
jgi:hypothetical protein